MDVCRL